MHTHYDNLKVARNAPPEVIKAAWRVLCQQYHPDKSTRPDATRVIQILNDAYEVLMDPEKRAAYDRGLANADNAARSKAASAAQTSQSHDAGKQAEHSSEPKKRQKAPAAPPPAAKRSGFDKLRGLILLMVATGLVGTLVMWNRQSQRTSVSYSTVPEAPSTIDSALLDKWHDAGSKGFGPYALGTKAVLGTKVQCADGTWLALQVDGANQIIATGCAWQSKPMNGAVSKNVKWSNGEIDSRTYCQKTRLEIGANQTCE